jgi:hypothetical protein
MVVFIYCYGARKPGQTGRFVYSRAMRVREGIAVDRALYTLYDSLRGARLFSDCDPKKNGIRVTYMAER